jgi:hypothetical protein
LDVVLVTFEAQVPLEQQETLTRAFNHVMRHRPDGVLLSVLTHESHDSTLWRILTVWESRDACDDYYRSNESLIGAYIFHLVGIVPMAALSEVVAFA